MVWSCERETEAGAPGWRTGALRFVQQYGRKARSGSLDPNDRRYDRKIEKAMRALRLVIGSSGQVSFGWPVCFCGSQKCAAYMLGAVASRARVCIGVKKFPRPCFERIGAQCVVA